MGTGTAPRYGVMIPECATNELRSGHPRERNPLPGRGTADRFRTPLRQRTIAFRADRRRRDDCLPPAARFIKRRLGQPSRYW